MFFKKSKYSGKYQVNTSPNRLKLPNNITFHPCCSGDAVENERHLSTAGNVSRRPLVLLFAWLRAEERHLEKYRQFWYKRGFDVLTVRTSPLDLLLPTIGARRNGQIVLRFLCQASPRYDQVVFHAFSVGCFQSVEFGRMLDDPSRPNHADRYPDIARSIRAMILDSCAYLDKYEKTLSYAITGNPITQMLIQTVGKVHLRTINYFTDNHYKRVQNYGFDNHRQIPALLFYSKNDPISDYRKNENLLQLWQDKNPTIVQARCWDQSAHVQHYRKYPEEYRTEVDNFLIKHNLIKPNTIQEFNEATIPETMTTT